MVYNQERVIMVGVRHFFGLELHNWNGDVIRPKSVNVSTEINLKDEKLMHTHRFLLFDRPKPPKNVEIVDYDMEKGSAILEK